MAPKKIAILGAGCGGQTFAGHLASLGHKIKLYNRSPERLGDLPREKKITLDGVIRAEGKVKLATTDIGEAVTDTDVILVATTALGHKDIARLAAPYLSSGQSMILNPGRTFGSLEVANEIYRHNPGVDVNICEANTLIYATRVLQPGRVEVYGVKEEVTVAAIRPENTEKALRQIKDAFPQMKAASNILETSLGNIGAVFHPTIMVFNRDKIAQKEPFLFYCQGATREAAEYMKKMDEERTAIAARLGAEVPSLEEWLRTRYGLLGNDLQELLSRNPAYQSMMAPLTTQHRYFLEDVPTGLVPFSCTAKALGINTPYIDQLIKEAEKITGEDFFYTGRTLERMGLSADRLQEDLTNIIYPRALKKAG